jgi:RNA polymerase sigma factor (sigma-70 family)
MEDRRTDKHLLLACRGGDEAAWEALVNRYQRLIYAIPRRAGLDEDQSAEVFQEVFTTLFQRMNDIEEPEKLHAWLVTTARRKTFRVFHKDRAWQQVGVDNDESAEAFAAIPDDAAPPDEVLVQLEEQHRIRTALASLDDRCRELLTMLFYQTEPPSYSEIAKMWGTSEGSIGPTRARCLQKMLRLLER